MISEYVSGPLRSLALAKTATVLAWGQRHCRSSSATSRAANHGLEGRTPRTALVPREHEAGSRNASSWAV
jgi:hypothetical protein